MINYFNTINKWYYSFNNTEIIALWTAIGTWAMFAIAIYAIRVAKKQVEIMKKSNDDTTRPYVCCSIVNSHGLSALQIKNYGKSAAFNIKLKMCDKESVLNKLSCFHRTMGIMVPEQEFFLYTNGMSLNTFFGKDVNPNINIMASYNDSNGQLFEEIYNLNSSGFGDGLSQPDVNSPTVVQLKKISESLAIIQKNFEYEYKNIQQDAIHEAIKCRANKKWLEAGSPNGNDLNLWLEAEHEFNSERNRMNMEIVAAKYRAFSKRQKKN